MTLWWIGNAVLLLVILPVVVYLLRGVLEAARSIVPSVEGIARVAAAGSKDLDAAALLLTTQEQVTQTVAGARGLRRLARRDPRRREEDDRDRAAVAGAAVAMIVAVLLIVLALVYYLVSTIVALRRISAGLDEVIAGVGEIVEKSAPVNDVVNAINEQLDAGVDLLEGLLVKKAGLRDAVGLVDGVYPGAARRRTARTSPRAPTIEPPRIGEVYTQGTLTLARLGREAPIAAASPDGRGAAERRGRQPRGAASSIPSVRHTSPEKLPGSPVIGSDAPVQYEQRDDIGAPRKRLPARRS